MNNSKKYGVGLALSGGGVRGIAHLGVMQAMIQHNYYPNVLAGTSAGAMAAVLYADGYTPKQILQFYRNRKFQEFTSLNLPKVGFSKTDRFEAFLKGMIRARTFEELQVPVNVIATDIEEGTIAVFNSGELIPAVVASCCVPIVFIPQQINGRYYVDGGIVKNFPVSILRDVCDTVIGINVSPHTSSKYRQSLKYVMERSYHYLSIANVAMDRELCDFLIETDSIAEYTMFEMERIDDIYEAGYILGMDFIKKNKEKLDLAFMQAPMLDVVKSKMLNKWNKK